MESTYRGISPIPELRTPSEVGGACDRESVTSSGTYPTTPTRRVPELVDIRSCSNIHIGPLYNNVDPSMVRTPPPGATSPIHAFNADKRRPATSYVQALIDSDRSISDGDVDLTSRHLGYFWRPLGRTLNYSDGELDNIDADSPRLEDKAYSLLSKWKQRESTGATIANLTRALMTIEAYDVVTRLRP